MGKKIAATLAFAVLSAGWAFGQTAPPPMPTPANVGPVEAELVKPLNLRRLEMGASVFARVTREWNGLDCSLRQGAMLEGTVVLSERHKGRGLSKLALAFDRAQCDGPEMKPMKLLLAAVAQPAGEWQTDANQIFKIPFNPTFNPRSGQMAISTSGIDFGSMAPSLQLTSINHHFPMSANVQPGDVIDIKGMKLELGTGPDQSSILSVKGRDVSLDTYTQLLLVPSSLVFVRVKMQVPAPASANMAGGSSGGQSGVAVSNAGSDLEVCAPPGCAVDLPVDVQTPAISSAETIALDAFGYALRRQMELAEFTNDDALAWLSPGQLLAAFNAHGLIRRQDVTKAKATRRIVRAVLFDAQSHNALRAVDWEIADTGPYLWPLPGNRILVHVQDQLRVYSEGLNVERSVALAGPLAFVRLSPNGQLIAVATLRERHSPELHARLQDELFAEPEEDVDIAILDSSFKTVARASTVSAIQPPTLLDEGQVVLLAQPREHYRLALTRWDNKVTTLTRFASLCTPQLSSMAPDLLFLLTCSTAVNRPEYRVIRADGKLLMHGEAKPSEIGHDVAAGQSGGLFAMKAVHAARDLEPGMDFQGTDLDAEELRVYSAVSGKRVFAVRVEEPTTSHGGYALSPDGAQLAVLSGTQIRFFPLPGR